MLVVVGKGFIAESSKIVFGERVLFLKKQSFLFVLFQGGSSGLGTRFASQDWVPQKLSSWGIVQAR